MWWLVLFKVFRVAYRLWVSVIGRLNLDMPILMLWEDIVRLPICWSGALYQLIPPLFKVFAPRDVHIVCLCVLAIEAITACLPQVRLALFKLLLV